ncbi:hypothetical protein C5167_014783 [Papaver somniferum]|uniref:Non-specific lipid-transfer protein n=1 Tax=Papaver somniferum TaxID=3469 RepID=A0A4Y7J455_PAPSO|nr:non-specific lipid-transfer protein 1-like [Papaver somniferum]RZC55923.1 hypothetical protein C5167_014783 [Papaver somniferum]
MATLFKLACVVLACMVMVAPYAAEGAISCGTVVSKLSPCIGYLTGGSLPANCCTGVKSLYQAAQTTSERQTVCGCLKNAAKSMTNIKMSVAASLPGKCGVSIPYTFSASIDCSKVN